MHSSSVINGLFLISVVILCASVHPAVSRTLDEIIAASSKDPSGFDFMADLAGDTVRQELDMILTKEQWRTLQGFQRVVSDADDPQQLSREKRKAIKNLFYRWPNSEIPYKITPGVFSSENMIEINAAIREWENYTCINFRSANSRDADHVVFEDGSGCSSYVGKSGGAHPIALAGGCRYKGVIAHEIGHAVGFFHEQNRPDRDEYIIIQTENIISPNLNHNFEKYPWTSVSTYDVPYDYRSIMHYGGRAFSGNGQYTIKTIDPRFQEVIGNREGLSFFDIKLANLMYQCGDRCGTSLRCPGHGFLGKDCKCWCPGNPVQLCSDSGSVVTESPVVTTAKPTMKPTARPCENMNPNCQGWADFGYCQTNTYVKTYCKRACHLCDDQTGTTQSSCKDLKEHCNFWKNEGYCTGTFEIFMSENCPMSCNRCKHSPIGEGAGEGSVDGNGNGVGQGDKGGVAHTSSSVFLVLLGGIVSILGKLM